MAVEKVALSTIRLPKDSRIQLKKLAAARGVTMEVAFAEAVEHWVRSGPIAQLPDDGRIPRELARIYAICKKLHRCKNKGPLEALVIVLDGLSYVAGI